MKNSPTMISTAHVILFRVGDKILDVVRVLHSAMDFKRHSPPEAP